MRAASIAVGAASFLVACGGGSGGPSPVDAGLDSAPEPEPDAGAACRGADGLPCLTLPAGDRANFDCAPSTPTPGALMNLQLVVSDDVSLEAPPAATPIYVFPDGVPAENCAGDCIEGATSDSGGVPVELAGDSRFAFRIAGGGQAPADVFPSAGYRIVRPTDVIKRVAFMTNGDIADIAAELGHVHVPGSGIVAGGIYDCDDRLVGGASIRVFVNDTEVTAGEAPDDPVIGYVVDSGPSASAGQTDGSGRYFASNLPMPGPATARLEAYGTREDGGERVLVACEEFPLLPETYTTHPLRPLRSDYPDGSACAAR